MLINPIKQYRILEMIPGILIWSTFIGTIFFSFVKPLWVISFILIFALLWFFRVIYFVIFTFIGWRRYKSEISQPWNEMLKEVTKDSDRELYHLIVLPTYEESFEVLETSIESYRNADYPSDKIMLVISKEERAGKETKDVPQRIKEKYKDIFMDIVTTEHPDGITGEMKGKGANAHWAGHAAKDLLDSKGIAYEDVIVSYFDVDTVVHKEYFSSLTYKYLTVPNPTRTAYQPVVLYNNNIWESPFFARIAAFGTTFWLMTDLARPDRLFTFSSHAMSMQALVDVGFWQRDIVTDDSRIFLQCFIHYKGDFTVTPMYVPISMDSVQAETYLGAVKNLYKQQRRWAYGTEHFPYMVWHFFKRDHGIPFQKKMKYSINLTEGMYSWATVPVVLVVLGYLPFYVAPASVEATALAQASPFILENILGLSMVGIFVTGFFSLLLLPPRPENYSKWRHLAMIIQWAFLPITLIIWGAIPAIAAQTRLMTGKYLGFWVTEKVRK